jgi:hypothetical protein
MREFRIIDAAHTEEQLKLRLKPNELEDYGEAFVPEFVYEVIRQLPRFRDMRVSLFHPLMHETMRANTYMIPMNTERPSARCSRVFGLPSGRNARRVQSCRKGCPCNCLCRTEPRGRGCKRRARRWLVGGRSQAEGGCYALIWPYRFGIANYEDLRWKDPVRVQGAW